MKSKNISECQSQQQSLLRHRLSQRVFITDVHTLFGSSMKYSFQIPFYSEAIGKKFPGWSFGRNTFFAQMKDSDEKLSTVLENFEKNMNFYFAHRSKQDKLIVIDKFDVCRYSFTQTDPDFVDVKNDFPINSITLEEFIEILKKDETNDYWLQFRVKMMNRIRTDNSAEDNIVEYDNQYFAYWIQYKPAYVNACHLNLLPMINRPCLPFVTFSDCSYEKTQISWFLFNERDDDDPVSLNDEKKLFLYPDESQFQKYLGFSVLPKDANNRIGRPYIIGENRQKLTSDSLIKSDIIIHNYPVMKPPKQKAFLQRLNFYGQKKDPKDIRVISYNLLAECYSSGKYAYEQMFPHCPMDFISINYRLPLILYELEQLQGELLCLQEVDISVFHQYLVPFLNNRLNMKGFIMPKRNITNNKVVMSSHKKEGPSIFFSSKRFNLIKNYSLMSVMNIITQIFRCHQDERPIQYSIDESDETSFLVTEQEMNTLLRLYSEWNNFCEENNITKDISERIEAASHAASCVCLLLEDKLCNNRRILVCSSHLYFHPLADIIRAIQAFCLHLHMKKLKQCYQVDGVIFGADMNSDPETPAVQLIRNGSLDQHEEETVQFLTSSYPDYPLKSDFFTHWVPNFSCILDYILFDENFVKIKNLPLINKNGIIEFYQRECNNIRFKTDCPTFKDPLDIFALPNQEHPSDHIPLAVDLRYNHYYNDSID